MLSDRPIWARQKSCAGALAEAASALTPRKVPDCIVPDQHAVGERNENSVYALVFKPVANLLANPPRGRGFGGGKQHQIARLAQRCFDRGPQLRRCGEARIVAKDAQRPAPGPRLAEFLLDRLQRRGNRLVLGVAVGNEGVVRRHARLIVRASLRGVSSRLVRSVPNGFSALHEARVPASHGALLWRQDLRQRKQGGTHPTRSKPDNGQIDLLHDIPPPPSPKRLLFA